MMMIVANGCVGVVHVCMGALRWVANQIHLFYLLANPLDNLLEVLSFHWNCCYCDQMVLMLYGLMANLLA